MKPSERIRALRQAKEVTQSELASSLKMNQSVVNRIEKGTRPLRDEEIKALSRYFGVTTDYLLGNEESVGYDPGTDKMMRCYRKLDAGNRALIGRMITALMMEQGVSGT